MTKHNDDDSVIFGYAASCNFSFRGERESGYTWGDWRVMTDKEKEDVYAEFVWQDLGVEVCEKDPED